MAKKLLKAVVWLVVLLAAAGFLFVWLGLGVNPLEGDAENLWDLCSNDVDFFVRFPGADLLSEPVVEGLGEEEGLDGIARAKDALMKAMRDAAEEANPQIPLGLFAIDPENDLRGKEVAFAGTSRGDLSRPRLDNFVLLVRIPGYAKFVSALTRDFVRSKVQGGDRISVVSGFYFKIKDPGIADMLAPYRSGARRVEPDALWFARIRDVLLVTDEPSWIEHALKGGGEILPGDVNFKTQFVPVSTRRGDVEILLREGSSGTTMQALARPDRNSTIFALSRIVPPQMAGNVIVQATPEEDGVSLRFVDHPPTDGYAKLKPQQVKLYEREKADLRFDYSENGIGRLVPRNGVVGALVIHAEADTMAALLQDSLSDSDRSNLDDVAAQASAGGRAYPSYAALLEEIGKDLSDTYMLVIHRPAIFQSVDLSTADDVVDAANPAPQISFSLVCAVRDSSSPEKVVEKVTQNLRYLGLKPTEDANQRPQQLLDPSGKFYVVIPRAPDGGWTLFRPAYAALTEGGKFFVFTSSVECMEAILLAAKDPQARLIAEPGVAACVGKLPREGTLSILVRGGALGDLMGDKVRKAFRDEYPDDTLQKDWRAKKSEEGIKDEDELDRLVAEQLEQFKASEYPMFRAEYKRRVAVLGALDTAVLGLSLGVGSSKKVTGEGYVLTRRGAAPQRQSD